AGGRAAGGRRDSHRPAPAGGVAERRARRVAGDDRARRRHAQAARGRGVGLRGPGAPPGAADRRLRGERRRDAGGSAVTAPTLRVCALYPDLMNIYADRGNIAVLRARCEWRGIGFGLAASGLGEPLDPDAHDLLYMGGGQDRDQVAVAEDMVETKRDALHAAASAGAVILAVCGGYQLLGHSYQLGDEQLPGIGLVDARTVREEGPRLIGNAAIEVELE